MAPDFGYFLSYEASRALTHSVTGLFVFALPVGLAVWGFYVALLEKATITLLPDRWHTRFAHTEAITPTLVARAGIALVLGAATHLLWDSFTHRGTFATDAFPVLLAPTPGFRWLPVYHLLHGLSSVVGLILLMAWARHLHRQPARSQVRPYRISERVRRACNGLLMLGAILGALFEWLPYRYARYDTQLFFVAVGSLSGLSIVWCCIAVAWRWRARRAETST